MTRRLLLSYLTIAVIVLIVLEIPLALFYRQRETGRLTVGVERDATALASIYEDALEHNRLPDPTIAQKYAIRTGVRVVVVNAGGFSLIDTAGDPNRNFSTRLETKSALAGAQATGIRRSDTLKTDLLYVAVPIASGGHVFGAVRLTLDTAEVNAAVHRFWLGLAGIAAVVLIAIAGIGWAIARSVTRPIRTLHTTAARFATGDLATADPHPGAPREIVALEATLNTMAQRLGQLLAEQRAFVADASHQLRTPLTALRLRLENLQSDPAAPASAGDIAAAIDETGRLSELVDDLLRLAHAEETATPQSVDLARLGGDRVDTWSAVADAAGVTLTLAAPAGAVTVSAVPSGVEQILDNLIDNAITASPSGADVTVTVTPGRSSHTLTIADAGPGLGDELKARALDRFWRLDSTQPGSGLGLPIAQALAQASGGSLTLGDSREGGLTATVTLPAAGSRPGPAQSARTRPRRAYD